VPASQPVELAPPDTPRASMVTEIPGRRPAIGQEWAGWSAVHMRQRQDHLEQSRSEARACKAPCDPQRLGTQHRQRRQQARKHVVSGRGTRWPAPWAPKRPHPLHHSDQATPSRWEPNRWGRRSGCPEPRRLGRVLTLGLPPQRPAQRPQKACRALQAGCRASSATARRDRVAATRPSLAAG